MLFDDDKTVRDEVVRRPRQRGRTGALKQISRDTLKAQVRKPRMRIGLQRVLDLAPQLRRALLGVVPQEPLGDDETTLIKFND